MPIYDATHVEYEITTGRISIVMDDGEQIPAYMAHPKLGTKFPGIALLHNWWGFDGVTRRLTNYFAQMGYYVIAPDLFKEQSAATPREAMALVEQFKDKSYPRVHASLGVLEKHHQCNTKVAAIGIGMGGSLAYEAAIVRPDLEAAVSYAGFPQSYLGRFKEANTPVLALYGSKEPYTKPAVIEKLKEEFSRSKLKASHRVEIFEGLEDTFFGEEFTESQRQESRRALNVTLTFLEEHLGSMAKPQAKPKIM